MKKAQDKNEPTHAALAVHTKFGPGRLRSIRVAEWLLRPLAWLLRTAPAPPPDQVRSILVLEQDPLGDVILLTPFLYALRSQFPDAHIALLGRPSWRDIVKIQDLVDEFVPAQIPWTDGLPRWKVYNPVSKLFFKFIRNVLRLRRYDFDWAFVAGLGDIRHNFALLLAGARRRFAYGFAGGGKFLTDVVEPDLSHPHHADLSLRLLDHAGTPAPAQKKLLSVAPEDEEFGRKLLLRNGIEESDLVVWILPRAGTAIKEWEQDRFQAVAEQIANRFGAKGELAIQRPRTSLLRLPFDRGRHAHILNARQRG